MFGTLLGGLPRPVGPDGVPIVDDDAAVVMALEAQTTAGLEPLTDGRLRWRGPFDSISGLDGMAPGPAGMRLVAAPRWQSPLTVSAWRFAIEHTDGFVTQALPGPYTLGRRLGASNPGAAANAFADALGREIRALADAGCALVTIEERDAHLIGEDPVERARFVEAHTRLLAGLDGIHVSLSIVGGSADGAGIATILAAPYASLAVDLIAGPDNWRLVTATPGDRGIVCGALAPTAPRDEGPELLLWAAAYAASSSSRGRDRVGLGTAGGLEGRTWADAVALMSGLGKAARLAERPLAEVAPHLAPGALDLRSAALGRYIPPGRPKRRTAPRP
jgi:methionine synthase II (cobalamin-independent)